MQTTSPPKQLFIKPQLLMGVWSIKSIETAVFVRCINSNQLNQSEVQVLLQ
ncbi:hypothetical protein Spb1_02260 [Planctopirus ephydatiae]|uniref:Uncharacterized protein n=1 Tax=Planctopirus ephydatiae TaxID=2528019 RepID=A0A518GIE3_9PLAN|nr:hypothetical protein Spb1_02260 [Planctopirus ephydatiae]